MKQAFCQYAKTKGILRNDKTAMKVIQNSIIHSEYPLEYPEHGVVS